MEMLILRLEAPLMKWGLRSLWNDRDTHILPTKSGIVGLIACALGLSRGDRRIEAISEALTMGVRTDRRGRALVDLQIVTSSNNPYIGHLTDAAYKQRVGEGGLLTYRHYIQDASFTVVLTGDTEVLKAAAEALKNPVFPLYLGAKSCVASRPPFETYTSEYASIEEALERYPRCEKRPYEKESAAGCYCEIENTNGAHIRQDEVKINNMREYAFRRVDVKYTGGS